METEQAEGEADQQGAERGGGVARGQQAGQRGWPGQQRGGQGEPGHGVDEEQRAVGGDLPVSLQPQVQMDVADPAQQGYTGKAQQHRRGPAAG